MYDNGEIFDEQDKLPAYLTKMSKQSGFTIPNNYFDDLPSAIEDAVIFSGTSLYSISKQNAFEVPTNYFEQMSSFLDDKIILDQSKLNTIDRENIFVIPVGYFDELPSVIQQKVTETVKTPVAGKMVHLFRDQFILPAIAASLVILLSIGTVMQFVQTSPSLNESEVSTIVQPTIEKNTIENIVYQEPDYNSTESIIVSQVDEKVIAEAIPDEVLASVSTDEQFTEEDINAFSPGDIGNYLFTETNLSSIIN